MSFWGHFRCVVNKGVKKFSDMKRIQIKVFFLFLHKNICSGYLLEAPCSGTSNEYPQHMNVS